MQKIILIGRLGGDVVLKSTPNGKQVSTFTLAVSNRDNSTTWFNVEAWEKVAEITAKFLSKGSMVAVDCEMKTQTWEKDGVKQYKNIFTASNVKFLEKVNSENKEEVELTATDIPF